MGGGVWERGGKGEGVWEDWGGKDIFVGGGYKKS